MGINLSWIWSYFLTWYKKNSMEYHSQIRIFCATLNEEKEMFAVSNVYILLDLGILFPFHKKCNLQNGGV